MCILQYDYRRDVGRHERDRGKFTTVEKELVNYFLKFIFRIYEGSVKV